MGYEIVGMDEGKVIGVKGVMIYMEIYIEMKIGRLDLIIEMRKKEGKVEKIEDMDGMQRKNKVMEKVMKILMFQIEGIKKMEGLLGKW